jgi:broad specificity phosphatase PhoE|tara:strand:- start:1602 stop:1877 length:276 start_codon:yes stop_codon:yes gene_type:complete
MKSLIVGRHGNYLKKDGNLTYRGREDIKSLNDFMKDDFEGSFWIASSPVPRAMQSAEILGKILGVNVNILRGLNCESDNLSPLFDWEIIWF